MPHLFTVATASGAGKLYLYDQARERSMGIWEIETGDRSGNGIKGEEPRDIPLRGGSNNFWHIIIIKAAGDKCRA